MRREGIVKIAFFREVFVDKWVPGFQIDSIVLINASKSVNVFSESVKITGELYKIPMTINHLL